MSEYQKRWDRAKTALYSILYAKGTVYALGVCIGLLARLSMTDPRLLREIEAKAKKEQQ